MRGIRVLWPTALGCLVAAAVALGVQSVTASASGPDLVNARLQGPWNLTVTVASYSGPKQPGNRPVGHQATDKIWFDSTCPAPGSCSVRIWGPNGPDPTQTAYFSYYSNQSGFEGTAGLNALQQSGSTYTVDIPIGGFGGFKCPPPGAGTRPAQHLSLRVTEAKADGPGWLATTLTGTESLVAGWGCNGTLPTSWVAENLSISGHPVGYVAASGRAAGLTVSSLAWSLNPPRQAFRSPVLIVANVLVTALVVLFVTFPSALFNSTLRENYAEITTALKRLDFLAAAARRGRQRIARSMNQRRREFAIFVAVLPIGAFINGMLDPRFGLTATSATSFVATLATLAYGIAVSALVALAYRRARGRETDWRFQALPLGLVMAGACVLVSRLTNFQPGYFYGLVCAVAFGAHLLKREDGHQAAVAAIVTMVLAVGAWFAWSLVNAIVGRSPGAWPLVLADDFLASVFVGGLVSNVIGLLPLGSLQGGKLIAWRRGVWVAIFAVAVFGLVQILIHPEQGAVHPSQAPLVTAILLFVGFGGGSIAFNRYFVWKGRPTRLVAAPARVTEPEREPAARV